MNIDSYASKIRNLFLVLADVRRSGRKEQLHLTGAYLMLGLKRYRLTKRLTTGEFYIEFRVQRDIGGPGIYNGAAFRVSGLDSLSGWYDSCKRIV